MLRGRQLGGDHEFSQVHQGLADTFQAMLQPAGGGRDHGALTRPQDIQRRIEQREPVDLVGDAVARHQRQRLLMLETVTFHGTEQEILVLARHPTQRMRESGSDVSLSQALLALVAELVSDRDPGLDPPGLSAEQELDPLGCEAVLCHQRADLPCLVQGRQRAWRGVGKQQQALVLGRGARTLHDYRDQLAPLLSPQVEALESIDHLVAPVLGGHHADGHGHHFVGPSQQCARPQERIAGAQGPGGQVTNAAYSLLVTAILLRSGHTDLPSANRNGGLGGLKTRGSGQGDTSVSALR